MRFQLKLSTDIHIFSTIPYIFVDKPVENMRTIGGKPKRIIEKRKSKTAKK